MIYLLSNFLCNFEDHKLGVTTNPSRMSLPWQVLVYVCEALRFRNSRERLARELSTHTECLEYIKAQVAKENGKSLEQLVVKKVRDISLCVNFYFAWF